MGAAWEWSIAFLTDAEVIVWVVDIEVCAHTVLAEKCTGASGDGASNWERWLGREVSLVALPDVRH